MNRILIGLLLFYGSFYAQEISEFDTEYVGFHDQYTPVTPNASNFLVYGNTPVNHATGVPQISIPLFTLEEDGVSIPISISYHAGGVKVDDLSSVVGLKWTLNAGGGIFRQVNDKHDEGGWLNPDRRGFVDDQWISEHPLYEGDTHLMIGSSIQTDDYYPDDFNFNFLGYSGGFIFNEDGTIVDEYMDALRLETIPGTGVALNFKATDPQGNAFYFDTTKETNAKDILMGHQQGLSKERKSELSGWMLDRIITRNNKTINFGYVPYIFEYEVRNVTQMFSRAPSRRNFPSLTCVNYLGDAEDTRLVSTSIRYHPNNQLIRTIESSVVSIVFNYEQDTEASDWKRKLVSVEILDKIKNKTKSFQFTYGKFPGDPRLRLDAVQEIGFDGAAKPPYRFEYYAGSLPQKGSLAKDLKGYYNGQENNGTLVPYSIQAYNMLGTAYQGSYANRNHNLNFIKVGSLRKITYPTGGSTEFNYEANSVLSGTITNPVYVGKGVVVAASPHLEHTIEGQFSVFTEEFSIENLGSQQYNEVKYYGESELCNNDPNSNNLPHIDCSRFNIHPVLSDGSLGPGIFTPFQVFGPQNNTYKFSEGKYVAKLYVRTAQLTANPTARVSLMLEWQQLDNRIEHSHYYTGGLRIRSIKDIKANGDIAKQTQYGYEGLHGHNLSIAHTYGDQDGKAVFSSESLFQDPRLIKPGHFYDTVTINVLGEEKDIKTVEHFEEKFHNKSIGSVLTQKDMYRDTQKVMTEYMEYKDLTNKTIQYWVVADQSCPPHNFDTRIRVYHEAPEPRFYYQKRQELSQRTTVDYLHQEGEPFNASISRYRYEYNNDLQVTKEVLDGRYYATSAAGITTGNLQEHSEGQYSEIRYTYPQDHKSASTTMATLSNKNIIGMPVSKKVLYKGNLIQGQYTDYDGNGNVIAGYRHHKGQASATSTPSHIPSDYELQATYKTTQGKPIEIHPKDGIPTSVLWDSSYQYVLASLKGVSASDLAGVTAAIDLKTTTDAQLRSVYATLRTTFSEAEITTYIHDPLMGVKEMTDPRGYTAHYDYDGLGRLINVKDQDHFLMTQYKYNYRKQQQ